MVVLAPLAVFRSRTAIASFALKVENATRIVQIFQRRTMASGGSTAGGVKSAPGAFRNSAHAALYAAYRPRPPRSLLEKIANHCAKTDDLLDVGCGSGQSTEPMRDIFRHIVGVDLSAAQIEQAEKAKAKLGIDNIEYKVAPAYPLPFESESFDAVTGSQCVHWFDLDQFYPEAHRVLRPGGVLAVYGYCVPTPRTKCSDEDARAKDRVMHFYSVETKEFWDIDRNLIDTCYRTLPQPKQGFSLIEHDQHIIDLKPSTLHNYISYISSWSNYHKLRQKHPDRDPLIQLRQDLSNIYGLGGGEDRELQLETNFFLMAFRKE